MLIIHVGTQKTGSTALQRHLFRNSAELLQQGIRYIEAGREHRHRTSHNELARTIQGKAGSATWDRLRDELARSNSRINLISAEGFWFCDPAAVKRQLPDAKDVQIVVYLRRQDQYLQSLYVQAVCGGRTQSFATWRETVPDRGKYLDAIDKWADAFGSESIVIRPYERDGVTDTIEDFSGLIRAEGLTKNRFLRCNPSPRQELLQFIRAFNNLKVGVDKHKLFLALIGKDSAYTRSCDILSYEESLALMKSYAEENRLLIEKYYRDQSSPLFPELVPFESPDIWEWDSEQYFKLTTDVLDVLIKFAADGQISQDNKKAVRRAAAKLDAGGRVNTNGNGRALRKIGRKNSAANGVRRHDPGGRNSQPPSRN